MPRQDVNRALQLPQPGARADRALLLDELTRDQDGAGDAAAQRRPRSSGALADAREDLRSSMSGVAGTLESIAAERDALELDPATRAPRVGAAHDHVAAAGSPARSTRVQPALRELSAARRRSLRRSASCVPTARAARPVLRQLRALAAAAGPRPAQAPRRWPRVAVPALRSHDERRRPRPADLRGPAAVRARAGPGPRQGLRRHTRPAPTTPTATTRASRLSVGGAGTQGLLSLGAARTSRR